MKKNKKTITSDFTIVGGGLAGVCSAITAARAGVNVTLVQDRSVLGGNASSEVRLWSLGATSHMGNNNRWSREGGVIDEILIENLYRNPVGNPIFFDNVLLDKIQGEKNITLLLNTAVYDCKTDNNNVTSLTAFNTGNETEYELVSKYFCDASGDGIVGYLSGADYTIQAESKETYNELIAPDTEYGLKLGSTIMFYSKDTENEVKYVAPNFALKDITKIPKYKNIKVTDTGCNYWWIEFGGRLDTIHENEEIKYELWKVIYGIWDYVKNSGNFPEAKNKTLEWVGTIPGKRESRRFYGDYVLNQNDVIEQKDHYDVVSHGGWAIDLHPADGLYSDKPSCNQYHAKGIYGIPYRTMYSRNVNNLFLTGRLISASHVAFGTTRVMLTSAVNGQVVGQAVAECLKHNLSIKELALENNISKLQQSLIKVGHYIPKIIPDETHNLASSAKIYSNDTLKFTGFSKSDEKFIIENKASIILPVSPGILPKFKLFINALDNTDMKVSILTSKKQQNFTPENVIETFNIPVNKGIQDIVITPTIHIPQDCYAFICMDNNDLIEVFKSKDHVTGVMTVWQIFDKKVATSSSQLAPQNSGVESFEYWLPLRYPNNYNVAIEFLSPLELFQPENIVNSCYRPNIKTNAWVGTFNNQHSAVITLEWDHAVTINNIKLFFDTNYDHALETTQFDHKTDIMENVVTDYQITNETGEIIHTVTDNYQTINNITLNNKTFTKLNIQISKTAGFPPALFGIICD